VDRQFFISKSALERKRSWATLARDLEFKHRSFKKSVAVPLADLAVARLRRVETDEPHLERPVKVVEFPGNGDANVAVVFRRPVRVEKFVFGSDQYLGITGKERRRGLDLDGFKATFEDPDELVGELQARGVPVFESAEDALVAVIGPARGATARARVAEEARAGRRTRLVLVAVGLFLGVFGSARMSFVGDDGGFRVGFFATLAILSLVIGGAASVVAASILRRRAGRPLELRPAMDRRVEVVTLVRRLAIIIFVLGGYFVLLGVDSIPELVLAVPICAGGPGFMWALAQLSPDQMSGLRWR
jgi:hypothetical protein